MKIYDLYRHAKDKIHLRSLNEVAMESFVSALNYAIPIFVLLIIIEWIISRFKGQVVFNWLDTISSLSSGVTNIIKSVLGLTLTIISYEWIEKRFGYFDLPLNGWTLLIVFVYKDFAGYWIHRLEHRVNYFWNRHIIHHSSEEFNLACALRQSISEFVGLLGLLVLPLALLGIPFEAYAIVAPIHLFAQFWYHTRLIHKMGVLEYVLVTPSHHRVHHAINEEYIDKNFSQIFIVWDRLFGTFQEEQPDVIAVYGVKRPVRTFNPFLINFKHLGLLILDFWRTKNWKDKLRIWWMPTGWRPADIEHRYPVSLIHEPESLEKYRIEFPLLVHVYFGLRLIISVSITLYFFNVLADVSWLVSLVFGLFLFCDIFSFTSLMDKSRLGGWFEYIKSALGIWLFFSFDHWLGLGNIHPILYWGFLSYLLISPFIGFWILHNSAKPFLSPSL